MRALESTVQAAFEDGAVLLNVIQSVSITSYVAETDGIPPWKLLVTVMPTLRSNIDNVCGNVAALVGIVQSQADACLKAGLAGSIGLRDAALYYDGRSNPSRVRNGSETLPPDVTGYNLRRSRDGSEVDIVDLADVLGPPPARSDPRDIDQNKNKHGRSDTYVDNLYDSTSGTRGHGDVTEGRNSPTHLDHMGLPADNLPTARVNSPPPEDEDIIDEDGACCCFQQLCHG